jgi:hypothetical protein
VSQRYYSITEVKLQTSNKAIRTNTIIIIIIIIIIINPSLRVTSLSSKEAPGRGTGPP